MPQTQSSACKGLAMRFIIAGFALLIVAGAFTAIDAQSAPPPLDDPLAKMAKRIAQLESRIQTLETQLSAMSGASPQPAPRLPLDHFVAGSSPVAPAPPSRLPDGGTAIPFNGSHYYILPVLGSGGSRQLPQR